MKNRVHIIIKVAERGGFEPPVPLLAVHAISSRAPSANSDISPFFIWQRDNLTGQISQVLSLASPPILLPWIYKWYQVLSLARLNWKYSIPDTVSFFCEKDTKYWIGRQKCQS